MEYHVDRRIVLSDDSKHKGLYKWSLHELDAEGKQVGEDQIPWGWTFYFTASELTVNDTISIEKSKGDDKDETSEVKQKQWIRAKMQPGVPWDRFGDRKPRYSMFGTDRTISDFELFIEKLKDGDEQEQCAAWGCVSYTSDIDFRSDTTDDTVLFHLHVRPDSFARYAEKIAAGEVDYAVLRLGRVWGFYSEWSPSIITNRIKVLTLSKKEQEVEAPQGCEIDPPRLGKVGEVELTLQRIFKSEKPKPSASDDEDDDLVSPLQQQPQVHVAAIADDRTIKLLSSLRVVAWIIAALLLAILITSR
jgi:hypothetical protein